MKNVITKAKNYKEKLCFAFIVTYMTAFACIAETHAETFTLFTNLSTIINDVKTGLVTLSSALAALCGVVGLIAILVSGERGAAKWIGFLKRVGIAYACILMIGAIMTLIEQVAQ